MCVAMTTGVVVFVLGSIVRYLAKGGATAAMGVVEKGGTTLHNN